MCETCLGGGGNIPGGLSERGRRGPGKARFSALVFRTLVFRAVVFRTLVCCAVVFGTMVLGTVLLMAGCSRHDESGHQRDAGADGGPPAFRLPEPADSFVLGAAGAPIDLFGPEDNPDFETAFTTLAQAGFNRFMPLFLTNEDGTGSQHFTYFLPTTFAPGSIALERSCEGPHNPWDAAQGRLGVVLPASLVVFDQPTDAPLDDAVVRGRLADLLERCLAGDARRLPASLISDEPANAYMASRCCDGDPASTFDLSNVAELNAAVHDVLGSKTIIVEAASPFFLPLLAGLWGIATDAIPSMTEDFWYGVDQTAPLVDIYGFDVYPVDLVTDFSPIVEYLGHARTRAPQAEHIAVLQGFGMSDMGIDVGTEGRRPTRAELRAMAFAAVAAGAQGLYWYGQSALAQSDALWSDLLELAGDLRRLSGVFVLPGSSVDLGNQGVVARSWEAESTRYLLVVNLTDEPASVDLPVPSGSWLVLDALTGEQVSRLDPGSDRLPLSLDVYESRILALVE